MSKAKVFGMNSWEYHIKFSNGKETYFSLHKGQPVLSINADMELDVAPRGSFLRNPTQEELEELDSSVDFDKAWGHIFNYRKMVRKIVPNGEMVLTPEMVKDQQQRIKEQQKELRDRLFS